MLEQLQRLKADPRDLAEMTQRIMHTRESRTVPPLAEIIRRLSEARSDRLKAEYEAPQLESGYGRRMTAAEKADVRVWRALSHRGVHHCDQKRKWITGGYCDCEHGLCWGEGVPAAEAKAKLEWAVATGVKLPPRPGIRRKGMTPLRVVVDGIMQ